MNRRSLALLRIFLITGAATILVVLSRRHLPTRPSQRLSWFAKLLVSFFAVLNRLVPWHKLPPPLGVMNLLAFRYVLRQKNLYDTSGNTLKARCTKPCRPLSAPHVSSIALAAEEARQRSTDESDQVQVNPRFISARTSEGICNDLSCPAMGAAGQRFGRNVPPESTFPDREPALLTPSPRVISQRLLGRKEFIPASSLNLLAAVWIQFQVHDWFAHAKSEAGDHLKIPLEPDDNWPDNPMLVKRTAADVTRTPQEADRPPTYQNQESHWWDASQLYGDDEQTTEQLRARDGRLIVDPKQHLLPIDPNTGVERTGFSQNWWLGLSLFHNLFAHEHNAILDALSLEYPTWASDTLFDTARLINTALMAKIHTVEWTPAILAHPTLKVAMDANWWGFFGENIYKLFGRLSDSEVLSGIPGSPTDHNGVPYALTEEFVAVYRLHSLLPDSIRFYSAGDGGFRKELQFADVAFAKAREVLDDGTTMGDVFYSFGIAHPGAITLHNYPNFLRDLVLPIVSGQEPEHLDLAAVDILRDRERGVPRYNTFRRLLHLPAVRCFEELTTNPAWAADLKEVYAGDIEKVDLAVGMLAEPFPQGFGFGDTAFRVFILMASRRLKSDRFFTTDYRREIYTQSGLNWINRNGLSSVLTRHYPELKPTLRGIRNAFAPWNRFDR
jgi:Animal haem peroxidase